MKKENVMTIEFGKPRKGTIVTTKDEFGVQTIHVRLYNQTDRQAKPTPLFTTAHGSLRRYKSKWVAEFIFAPKEYSPADMADVLEDEASDMADWLSYELNGEEERA